MLDLGRRRRPRLDGDPDRARRSAAIPVAVVSRATTKVRVLQASSAAQGYHQPQRLQPLGHAAALDRRSRSTGSGRRARAPSARRSGRSLGEREDPRIVFEHPGEDTIPTSIFVCDTGGMVVICAGTTGYNATSTCATSGCARSASRARTSRTTSRRAAQRARPRRQDRPLPVAGGTFAFDWDSSPSRTSSCTRTSTRNGNMAVLVGAPKAGLGAAP